MRMLMSMLMKTMVMVKMIIMVMVMGQEDVPDVLRTVTSRSNEKGRERERGQIILQPKMFETSGGVNPSITGMFMVEMIRWGNNDLFLIS